ncbi:SRPBCC domain-containing protein [Paenibacillus sp. JCM 10914]|uniref:SRPBCC family protein n=1 Tax=Paenibacillus sp. JCM 10914 TaxID=1236974 RepID=UPI0003CCAD85|nr:SRPBCC domain-containing protein [Paenibacillus sp. JCM 10914]GAE08260.1 Aha1 domain protein [Paenibacillus sp. JCM 10914]
MNIEHLQTVKAPISEVYNTLTTEKGLAAIWTRDLRVSEQVGGISEFRFGPGDKADMHIVQLESNRRIVWSCTDSHPEWIGTTISFDLEDKSGVTAITLRQMDWREVTDYYRTCNYHWAMFLLRLKRYCEEGIASF